MQMPSVGMERRRSAPRGARAAPGGAGVGRHSSQKRGSTNCWRPPHSWAPADRRRSGANGGASQTDRLRPVARSAGRLRSVD